MNAATAVVITAFVCDETLPLRLWVLFTVIAALVCDEALRVHLRRRLLLNVRPTSEQSIERVETVFLLQKRKFLGVSHSPNEVGLT